MCNGYPYNYRLTNLEKHNSACQSSTTGCKLSKRSSIHDMKFGTSLSFPCCTIRCHVCLKDHPTQHCPQTANPFMFLQMRTLQTRNFSSKTAHTCRSSGSKLSRRYSNNSDEHTPRRIPLFVVFSTQSLEIAATYKIAHFSTYARYVEVATTVRNAVPPLHQTKGLGAVAGESHIGKMCNKLRTT